jgi:hypothetical protein
MVIPFRDIAVQCTAKQCCKIMFGRFRDWMRVATRYDRRQSLPFHNCPRSDSHF